jgi:hypothetical protein
VIIQILQENFNPEKGRRWTLFIEDYFPCLCFIKGDNNNLADTLNKLPNKSTILEDFQERFFIPLLNVTENNIRMHPSMNFIHCHAHLVAEQQSEPLLKKEL